MRLEPTIALERKLGLLSSEFSKEELIRAYAQEILDASDLQRQINAEIGPAVEVLPGLVGMLEQGAREWLDYAKNVEVAVAAQKKANETLPTARGFRSRGVPGVGQGRNTIFDPILGPLPKAPVEEQLRAINKRVKTIDRLNSSAIPATAKLQKLKDAAKLLESEIPLLIFEIDDL